MPGGGAQSALGPESKLPTPTSEVGVRKDSLEEPHTSGLRLLTSRTAFPAPARPGMAIRPAAAAAAAADGMARGARAPCTLGTERPGGKRQSDKQRRPPCLRQKRGSCPSSCKQRHVGGGVGGSGWPSSTARLRLLHASRGTDRAGLTVYMRQIAQKAPAPRMQD